MIFNNEEYKIIKQEPNYAISKTGKVLSIKRNCLRNTYIKNNGYEQITIGNNHYYIHRLVAEAFLPNPNNYTVINHKDHNRKNNHVDNLEWCTTQYNNSYSNCNQRLKECRGLNVKVTNLDTNEVNKFLSIRDAAKFLNIGNSALCYTLSHSGIYKRKYKIEYC